MESNKQFNSAE